MASGSQAVAEKVIGAMGKVAGKVEEGANDVREAFLDHDVREDLDHGAKPALTVWGKLNPAYRPFTDGAKKGIKYYKSLCRAQRLMNKLNPDGVGTPSFVPTLAGDLFRSFPALFSYSVKIQGIVNIVTCQSNEQQIPAAATGARITGILVGQETVPVQTPAPAAYQSTAQLAATTYYNLERSRLARPLREAVIRQMNALNRGAILFPPTDDELCYAATAAALRLPPIAVLLASDNGGMQTMELELGVATDIPVWYQKSSTYCLGIQRTIQLLTLGSP